MHLRGAAFDTYDGRSWSRSLGQRDTATREGGNLWIRRPPDPHRDRVWRMDLEPIDPPVLFAPLNAVAMRVRQRGDPVVSSRLEISSEPEWTFRYGGSDERGVRYEVYVGSEAEGIRDALSRTDEERYTALPKGVSDRVRKLAHQVVRDGATPLEKARSDRRSICERRSPTTSGPPSGKSPDPLDDFLFVSRRGHCEFYSTAMVVLLRELHVAARNVTGFIGGSYNRFGHYYAVRQGDAHSWVEVFVPERGWQTFDPTPPAEAAPRSELSGMLAFIRDIIEATGQRWDRYVVGYDLRQQVYLFHSHVAIRLAPRFARPRSSAKPLVIVVCSSRAGGVVTSCGAAQGASPKCHDHARSRHPRADDRDVDVRATRGRDERTRDSSRAEHAPAAARPFASAHGASPRRRGARPDAALSGCAIRRHRRDRKGPARLRGSREASAHCSTVSRTARLTHWEVAPGRAG